MLYPTNWDSAIWISSTEALLRVLGVGAFGGFNVVCLVKIDIVIPTTSFFVPKARITTTDIFKTVIVTLLPLGLPTLSSTSPPPSTRLPHQYHQSPLLHIQRSWSPKKNPKMPEPAQTQDAVEAPQAAAGLDRRQENAFLWVSWGDPDSWQRDRWQRIAGCRELQGMGGLGLGVGLQFGDV